MKKNLYKGHHTLFDSSARKQKGKKILFHSHYVANKKEGFVLVVSVLVLTTLLLVGTYLISSAESENKISNAQNLATRNYYLAETGVHEMIWKIQNDTATSDAFLAGTLSSSNDISRSNVFSDPNASYLVSAMNTVSGEAWITATSTYQIGNSASQRVIKSYISQATGDNTDWDFGIFSGGRGTQQNGNLTFKGNGVAFTANGASLHANQVFLIQGVEIIINDGAATASNNIEIVAGGTLTLNNSYQDAPTSTVDILMIDFESSSPDSWKNRATATYSSSDFDSLPDGTILNGIIWVEDNCKIDKKNFTINGVLVCEDDAEIVIDGNQTININAHATYGGGLLAKDDAKIVTTDGTIHIEGLVYAGDDLDIESNNTNFTIDGGLAGFDTEIIAYDQSIILNFVAENFIPVIDPELNPTSPIIQIDHWEEQY